MAERMKLSFIADFFNVFNSRPVRLMDQNFETQGGVLNFDFSRPGLGANAYLLPLI
jgi:hypothetical protein